MSDIERISKKIAEEKDNLVAKAFTVQIASLLLTNGIVPIMTEYRKNDLETITDTDRYKLVYELGVTFDSLDTTEHDKQIRVEVIEEVLKQVEFEEKWLFECFKENGCKYSSKDIDIAFNGIKHHLHKLKEQK